jgi:integrase/recombinase XerD
MPVKLTTTIAKISSISNCTNKELLDEFNQYMKSIGTSESLKITIYFARFLGSNTTLISIRFKKGSRSLLFWTQESKTHRATRTKNGIRKEREVKRVETLQTSDWVTPSFVQIKEKGSNRISPYFETELWEIQTVVKYHKYNVIRLL